MNWSILSSVFQKYKKNKRCLAKNLSSIHKKNQLRDWSLSITWGGRGGGGRRRERRTFSWGEVGVIGFLGWQRKGSVITESEDHWMSHAHTDWVDGCLGLKSNFAVLKHLKWLQGYRVLSRTAGFSTSCKIGCSHLLQSLKFVHK